MFLFAQKSKTPVSTYTDSYCLLCSVKKTIQEQALLQLWKRNKFVMQGLTMPLVQNLGSRGQPARLIKAAMQEYYRNATDPTGWLAPKNIPACRFYVAEKYNAVFVNKDKYITWRMGPYNSTAWNKHSSYLPLLPKEMKMETFLHSIPVLCHPKPACLNQSGNYPCPAPVSADMLLRLSQLSPLSLWPVYTMMGRGPFQGYYSPCSGHHYGLQGMDYYIDGAPSIRRHLHILSGRAVRSILCCSYSPRAMVCASTHHPKPSSLYTSPRWNTSHFRKTGGVQRSSYTIHPDFASEAYSATWLWWREKMGFH
ncbi:LOW QUALITY PROTEIN: sperm microtubule inner protein 6-like [Pluvialis apricaria]